MDLQQLIERLTDFSNEFGNMSVVNTRDDDLAAAVVVPDEHGDRSLVVEMRFA